MINIGTEIGIGAGVVVVGISSYITYRKLSRGKYSPQDFSAEYDSEALPQRESDTEEQETAEMNERPSAGEDSSTISMQSDCLGDIRESIRRPDPFAATGIESIATFDPGSRAEPGLEEEPELAAPAPFSSSSINTEPASLPAVNEKSSLPENEKTRLLNAAWYRCENPYCNHTQFLDVHHIIPEEDGGTNRLDNLVILCSYCHSLAHNNEIPIDEMQKWITKRQQRFKNPLEWKYK